MKRGRGRISISGKEGRKFAPEIATVCRETQLYIRWRLTRWHNIGLSHKIRSVSQEELLLSEFKLRTCRGNLRKEKYFICAWRFFWCLFFARSSQKISKRVSMSFYLQSSLCLLHLTLTFFLNLYHGKQSSYKLLNCMIQNVHICRLFYQKFI